MFARIDGVVAPVGKLPAEPKLEMFSVTPEPAVESVETKSCWF